MRHAVIASMLLAAAAAEISAQSSGTGYAKLSPFEAVQVTGDKVEVRVEGSSYELLAIDGLEVGAILAFCRKTFADRWEKRFTEDLVEVLSKMERAPGATVALSLRDAHGRTVTLDAPMTREKRQAIMAARNPRRPPPETMTSAQVAEDLAVLTRALDERHAYAKVSGYDYRAAVEAARARLGDGATPKALAREVALVIAELGDCHARVRGLTSMLPRGQAPFEVADLEGRVVSLVPGKLPLDPERPFLVALDGRPVDEWLTAAGRLVPKCAPQYVRAHALERLPLVAHLRAELGLPSAPSLAAMLASGDGTSVRVLNLPLVQGLADAQEGRALAYHRVLDGGVGYLRLATMGDDAEFLGWLVKAVTELAGTRALVIDVRDNGGGSREPLRVLMPALMRAGEPPRVVNVAAYRLPAAERPENPEGHLPDRFLYPLTATRWSDAERAAVTAFAAMFRPAWTPPSEDFTSWHYFAIGPGDDDVVRHAGPVVVLMNGGCFSATDIFLGALKGRPGVTLVGTPSGGGSGRAHPVTLPHSTLEVMLSTMASFRPDGSRYDGAGIEPDVLVPPALSDILGQTDSQLEKAKEILGSAGPAKSS